MSLKQEWNVSDRKIEVICIDCFDTLLHRVCSAYEVLNIWCRMLSEKLPFSEKKMREIWNYYCTESREAENGRSLFL